MIPYCVKEDGMAFLLHRPGGFPIKWRALLTGILLLMALPAGVEARRCLAIVKPTYMTDAVLWDWPAARTILEKVKEKNRSLSAPDRVSVVQFELTWMARSDKPQEEAFC